MDGALELVDHVLGPAVEQDRDRARILALLDHDHLVRGHDPLLDEPGTAEVLGLDVVERGQDPGAGRAGDALQVRCLETADGEDAGLREVVLGEVVDPLLREDHVRARCKDLLGHLAAHALVGVQERLLLARRRDR